ncbi:MAG: ABC transporter ATP-binding protein [Dehalococcoidia bacterium]|nr:ABC transporter ATP-binding protein [Dehalococcoidia bacterium]
MIESNAVSSPAGAPAVEVRGLSHAFDAPGGGLAVLSAVDLAIAPGEFVSLVGPSGCGKTTLLRAVAGLLAPSTGGVEVLGGTPRQAQRAHAYGLVAQDPGLLPWRSVHDNVRLGLELTGRQADVPALLGRVGLGGFERYRPGELSGGMRQRAALARALVHGPRLLLMDEPFGALDELSREAMRVELLRLWEAERITVLFVTHAVREAVLLSDRVVVMSPRPGRIVADIPVPLARPRSEASEDTPEFLALVARVRASLHAAHGSARAASTPGDAL